jgi:transcriptional regulator with XRE-family HTH domain
MYQYRRLRKDLGASLRAARKRKGLSQQQLALIMNTHQADLSKIENGRKPISVEQLLSFAVILFDTERVKIGRIEKDIFWIAFSKNGQPEDNFHLTFMAEESKNC